jgi:hypothetical protein
VLGVSTGLILAALWPRLSVVWVGLMRSFAVSLAGDRGPHGPGGASVTLPVVIAALVACPLKTRRKVVYVVIAFGLTLGCEFVWVLLGNLLQMPEPIMSSVGGGIQHALPIGVLMVAMREALGVVTASSRP